MQQKRRTPQPCINTLHDDRALDCSYPRHSRQNRLSIMLKSDATTATGNTQVSEREAKHPPCPVSLNEEQPPGLSFPSSDNDAHSRSVTV
jgi:hypothetical protein